MSNLLMLNLVFSSSGHSTSNWVRGGHGTYAVTIQVTFRTLVRKAGTVGFSLPWNWQDGDMKPEPDLVIFLPKGRPA